MCKRRMMSLVILLSILAGPRLEPAAWAEVVLSPLIGDNMVLQQGMSVPLWGWADPNEKVSVTFGQQSYSAEPDANSRWEVKLSSLKAGGPYELVVAGKNRLVVRNILIGEVWVCSGQSNMEWNVARSLDPEKEIATADVPDMRLFQVVHQVASRPQTRPLGGPWKVCDARSVPNFSAVAYFFGKKLCQELHVPIGLIWGSNGGTFAEAWTGPQTLAENPAFRPFADNWRKEVADYPGQTEKYTEELKKWLLASAAAEEKHAPLPEAPAFPPDPRTSRHRPGGLYNGMIAPLIPFALRGVIWYQGESNAPRAWQYRKVFPAMIADWRRNWGQGDFPFLFVQLADFGQRPAQPGESNWAELREAQVMTLAVPQTAMAVAIDVGECDDIHPANKQAVGQRLALAALAQVYGREVAWSGPIYEGMDVTGNKIRLRFKHAEGGLVTQDNEPVKSLAIAGEDRKFVWAQAKIDGETLLAWHPDVARPVAVRYGWADCPDCNLYNKAGLPASPFRTDDWPAVTQEKP
jgi:sialate O-acetylesterase